MEVHFILVEPAVPENIGASARAIKTMTFNRLRLVNPVDHLSNEAFTLAHGSADILKSANVFPTLEQALHGIDFVIGTSAKTRRIRHDYYHADQLVDIIHKKGGSIRSVGMVFGREESGLTNDELNQCHIIAYVPMAESYPSLNLAQAVMIFAYELSALNLKSRSADENNPSIPVYAATRRRVAEILSSLGMNTNQALYNRIMERVSIMGEDDIHLVCSICKFLENRKG
jgi:tRNA/rRNA methyltransferase